VEGRGSCEQQQKKSWQILSEKHPPDLGNKQSILVFWYGIILTTLLF
jgi:hypothetical protein